MQTFWIQEAAITASSIRDSAHDPAQARLHGNGAWMPLIQDGNQFLQIDFENEANVSAVAIQGHPTNDFWVSKYSLSFSKDGKLWDDISEVLFMRSTEYGCLSVVLNFSLFFWSLERGDFVRDWNRDWPPYHFNLLSFSRNGTKNRVTSGPSCSKVVEALWTVQCALWTWSLIRWMSI